MMDSSMWSSRRDVTFAEVSSALADQRVRVDGQAIVTLNGSGMLMHELLARLLDWRGRPTVAASFIPLAERRGLITDIDLFVLRQGIELAAGGHAVAVNVSTRSICDHRYRDAVLRLLGERRVQPEQLTLEITETALLENLPCARRFAQAVTEAGCKLALDDFGTGYGSFNCLKHVPVHFLKIDREFVRDSITDARSRAVIRAIVGLASSFGQQTVAEGVEDPEVMNLLHELGVDHAQGFHVERPHWMAGPVGRHPAVQAPEICAQHRFDAGRPAHVLAV